MTGIHNNTGIVWNERGGGGLELGEDVGLVVLCNRSILLTDLFLGESHQFRMFVLQKKTDL